MKRFDIDRLMEDWIVPIGVAICVIVLILLYMGVI